MKGMVSKVAQSMNEQLLKPCTFEEVSVAVEQMATSPRPDGLTAEFYRDHWSVIGKEVFTIFFKFFHLWQF